MTQIAGWLKRLRGESGVTGALNLQPGIGTAPTRNGKSPLSDAVAKAIAASGAEPGDIVEVDDQGAARIVGRRLHLAGEECDISEQAIRSRLGEIYGDDASNLADVTTGSNVVVFRTSKRA